MPNEIVSIDCTRCDGHYDYSQKELETGIVISGNECIMHCANCGATLKIDVECLTQETQEKLWTK